MWSAVPQHSHRGHPWMLRLAVQWHLVLPPSPLLGIEQAQTPSGDCGVIATQQPGRR